MTPEYPRIVGEMTWHLIRHGQSLANAEIKTYRPIYGGNPRVPLTLVGHEQARETAEVLAESLAHAGRDVRVEVISSGFLRAMQTAEHVLHALISRPEIQTTARVHAVQSLSEIEIGAYSGALGTELTDPEAVAAYDAFRQARKDNIYRAASPAAELPGRNGTFVCVPGESVADVHARVAEFLGNLAQAMGEHRTLLPTDMVLATHGFVQRTIVMSLNPEQYDEAWFLREAEPRNGEWWDVPVTLVEVAKGQFRLQAGDMRVAHVPEQQVEAALAKRQPPQEVTQPLSFITRPWLEAHGQQAATEATLMNLMTLRMAEEQRLAQQAHLIRAA